MVLWTRPMMTACVLSAMCVDAASATELDPTYLSRVNVLVLIIGILGMLMMVCVQSIVIFKRMSFRDYLRSTRGTLLHGAWRVFYLSYVAGVVAVAIYALPGILAPPKEGCSGKVCKPVRHESSIGLDGSIISEGSLDQENADEAFLRLTASLAILS